MKRILALEEMAMFGISIAALVYFNVPWWCYLLLALGPDISFVGYLAGNRAGAVLYNLFHHKAAALLFFAAGFYFEQQTVLITGIILFGHSSMDRMFGYGLKYFEGFKHTHLGQIGKN